jgi:endonuclease I
MRRCASPLLLLLISSGGQRLVLSQPFPNCDLSSYYSTLTTSPQQTSRNDMHQLIKATHRHELPYTSATSPDVWDGLLATDTDATGQLIHLIYADKDVAATPYDSGSCDSWNREHLWSRSRGVGDTGMDNTDLHHMRPADCNVNAARSNRYFAQCGTVDLMSSCVSPAHLEAADDTERDTKSFLPPASKRGDIARAILYMDLRYDGDDPNTENLVASDCPENVPNGAGMGYLSQLLQWHLDDPPDEEERNRNGEICTSEYFGIAVSDCCFCHMMFSSMFLTHFCLFVSI